MMKKLYEILKPLGFDKKEIQIYHHGRYNSDGTNSDGTWCNGYFEKTGKFGLNGSMAYGTSRTLLKNPEAKVLAYLNLGDEIVFGIIETKRKFIKGFKATRNFRKIFEEKPIETLKEIKRLNQKPICFIDKDIEKKLAVEAL